MAFHLYEDTWETSTTTGTGDYILAGAVSGWRAFSAQYANADTCWYSAYDGSNFEQGKGTYNSGANSLTRTAVYRSTNAGAAVSWAAGTRNIVVAPLGVTMESLLAPGNTGYAKRTADNTWAYDQAGQISNTTATNDSASAGNLGEYLSASVAFGSAVSITNNTPKTIASLSLTAGDWDVAGLVQYTGAGSTVITSAMSIISDQNNALPTGWVTIDGAGKWCGSVTGDAPFVVSGPKRLSLSGTTTYYLIALALFSVSTMSAAGSMRARRVR